MRIITKKLSKRKSPLIFHLLLLGSLLFGSCLREPSYPRLLVEADSAMRWGHYDEADSLLSAYSRAKDKEKISTHRYYQLLQLESKFLCGNSSIDDMLLVDSLENYYRSISKEKHAKIHNLVILNMHENHPELLTAENLYQNAFMDTVNIYVCRALALNPDSASNELYSVPNLINTCNSIREVMLTESSLGAAVDSIQCMFPEYTQEFDILNTFLESLDLNTVIMRPIWCMLPCGP